jgi:hypothetical protein
MATTSFSGLKYMLLFALVCGINTSLENQENVTSLILNDIGNQIENIAFCKIDSSFVDICDFCVHHVFQELFVI